MRTGERRTIYVMGRRFEDSVERGLNEFSWLHADNAKDSVFDVNKSSFSSTTGSEVGAKPGSRSAEILM